MKEKNLYIIAGCNGVGKTTASFTILPESLDCKEFVNADEIAKGLSPFQPEKVAFEAGKIMLRRIEELFNSQENFAFETTLASKIYKHKIQYAKRNDYNTILLFFWLENPDLAKERVKIRVSEGGHNIPEDIIERRYINGIKNLFSIYLDIVDQALIFDNSEGQHHLIAEKNFGEKIVIYDCDKFNNLKKYYDKRR
ncbi:zeta toxin family protein [Elizabethkingia meningoseptica]|uniref:zeta toxin family protein n=1 Tax=Elizabethkingia meningoseptica TaxID=238 RepID=UPI0020110CC7|nr:zeta toxin family protein [Elizabethkingia meningoseptica]MCL1674530.1 zeta toxin family protein [Elizabethkingia meningoseptica]MCL1686271.1 zeta toxin family protein [Elizabethkingia meningoseptica]